MGVLCATYFTYHLEEEFISLWSTEEDRLQGPCGWDSLSEWSKRKKWRSYLKTGEKETIDENRKTKETKAGVPGMEQETASTGQGAQPVQQDCTGGCSHSHGSLCLEMGTKCCNGLLYLHRSKCVGLWTWLSRAVNRTKEERSVHALPQITGFFFFLFCSLF